MRPEPEPASAPECPAPPPFLTGYAVDEWWRIAPELHTLGLLTVVDTMPLAAYCTAYARWRDATEALARMAEADPETRGLVVRAADGNQRGNPLVKIVSDAANDMLCFASAFGLTPVARTRLSAGVHGQPPGGSGKFAGLLYE